MNSCLAPSSLILPALCSESHLSSSMLHMLIASIARIQRWHSLKKSNVCRIHITTVDTTVHALQAA